jgi:nicotinamide mononucleotide transporter
MSPVEIAAVAFTLASVVLTVRQSVWCWPVGIVGCALFASVFLDAKLYADVVLQAVYVVVSFVGWWRWYAPGDAPELPITRLSASEAAGIGFAVTGLAAGWGSFLATYTDASLPYWDSLTVAMSLAANWLLTRKVLENWLIWIAADVLMVGVYGAKELWLTSALYVVFTVLAYRGWTEWRRSIAAVEVA